MKYPIYQEKILCVEPLYYRIALLSSDCASAPKCSGDSRDLTLCFLTCPSQPISSMTAAHKMQCMMLESQIDVNAASRNLKHCLYEASHGSVGAKHSNRKTITSGKGRVKVLLQLITPKRCYSPVSEQVKREL